MAAIKVKFAQHAPIELKFAWNDHCDMRISTAYIACSPI